MQKDLLNKVIAIEAFAEELKIKATGLRSEMERFYAPSPKRGREVLSKRAQGKIISKRRKNLLKK